MAKLLYGEHVVNLNLNLNRRSYCWPNSIMVTCYKRVRWIDAERVAQSRMDRNVVMPGK
jgi:hypothetical protein